MTEQSTYSFIKSSRKRRIAAYLVDHFFFTFLMVISVFLVLGPDMMNQSNPGKMIKGMFFVMIPGFLLYFAKDSYKGISIGRWIFGIMVRNENDPEETPSFGRLFARNLFVILWPVEFLVLAFNKDKKRLGDQVARTVVVKNTNKPGKLPRAFVLALILAISFGLIMLITGNAMKNSDAYKAAIKEIEQNEEIKTETGGIRGYGMIPKGNIQTTNGRGHAQLEITVLGNSHDVTVTVYLKKEAKENWQVEKIQK